MSTEKKKVYMAIADTGGGHRAAARSMDGVYEELFGDEYEIIIDNVFANTKKIGKKLENAYAKLNSSFTFIFSMGYVFTSFKPFLFFSDNVIGRTAIPVIAEKLKKLEPDLVVSIHPLVSVTLKKAIKRSGINTKIAVVITDPITAHIGWFTPDMYDLYIVSSERLRTKLIKHGIEDKKIKIYNPPLNKQFQKSITEEQRNSIKDKFGFPKDKKIIFFAGSGEGFKNIHKYVKRVLNKKELMNKAYFVVVTGKNEKQKEMLEEMTKNHSDKFKILGFTKEMHDLTASADIVICKAGPATTYQALVLKRPIIHTMYIYGQEKGNTELIRDNNYGKYIPNIKKLIDSVEDLVINEEKLEEMKSNLEKTNFTNGTEGIVKELHGLLSE